MSTEKNYLGLFDPKEVYVLGERFPLLQHYLFEIRDVEKQKDREKFRNTLQKIGSMMAWQLSSSLEFHSVSAITPLGIKNCLRLHSEVVLATILRAGLPFWNGFLDVFPEAEVSFAGAYRSPEVSGSEPSIEMNYLVSPRMENKTLLLIDPMLATGKSLVAVLDQLLTKGHPKKILICGLIATPQGISFVQAKYPNASFWLADLDEGLDSRLFIVPGLGDAGDLSFGEK